MHAVRINIWILQLIHVLLAHLAHIQTVALLHHAVVMSDITKAATHACLVDLAQHQPAIMLHHALATTLT